MDSHDIEREEVDPRDAIIAQLAAAWALAETELFGEELLLEEQAA